jgi:predicted AlkP superfamily phosphohydrolase/phosphomutase
VTSDVSEPLLPNPESSSRDLMIPFGSVGATLGMLTAAGTYNPVHEYLFALPTPISGWPVEWLLRTSTEFGLRISPIIAATTLGLLFGSGGGAAMGAIAARCGALRWPALQRTWFLSLAVIPLVMALIFLVWYRREIDASLLLYSALAIGLGTIITVVASLLARLCRALLRLSGVALTAVILALATGFSVFLQWPQLRTEEAGLEPVGATHPVLFVGLDAASWANLGKLLDSGRLPQIAALRKRGSFGQLQSSRPTWSPVIWTTMVTGRDAGAHGIVNFALDGVPYTSNSRTDWALWEILPLFGRTSAFHYWWASWPAEPIAGRIVTDRFEQRALEQRVHPASEVNELDALADQARQRVHPIEAALAVGADDDLQGLRARHPEKLRVLEQFLVRDEIATTLGEAAIRSGDFDLVGSYLRGIDAVGHKFLRWHYQAQDPHLARLVYGEIDSDQSYLWPVVDRMNEFSDAWLGRLVAATRGEWNIVVVSDHGMTVVGNLDADEVEPETGHHHISGLLLMAGPDIRAGQLVRGASIYDVFPTLLYLLDLPVPADLSGRVITQALRPSLLERRPLKVVPGYGDRAIESTRPIPTSEDEDYIEELRALGYVID